MSKRTILLLTRHMPDSDQVAQVAIVIAPTRQQALRRIKELAKEKQAEYDKELGFEGDFKLGRYQVIDSKPMVGEAFGRFDVVSAKGPSRGDGDEWLLISEVQYAEVQ